MYALKKAGALMPLSISVKKKSMNRSFCKSVFHRFELFLTPFIGYFQKYLRRGFLKKTISLGSIFLLFTLIKTLDVIIE